MFEDADENLLEVVDDDEPSLFTKLTQEVIDSLELDEENGEPQSPRAIKVKPPAMRNRSLSLVNPKTPKPRS